MKIKSIRDVEGVEIPKPFRRMVKIIFDPDGECMSNFNLISTIIYPHSSTDYRPRDRTEVIYIISGQGILVCDDQEYSIGPDTIILAEEGNKIQLKNSEYETLKLLSFYIEPFKAVDLYQNLLESAKRADG